MEKEKVLVVGTGKSGIAATQLLLRTGKMPVLFDSNAELDKDEILGKLSLSGDEKKQVEIVLGDLTEEEKKELSGVVLSPGVPTDTEFVNDLRNRGLLISGEIELAFEQEKGAVLAITGTNGKTTTTTLLGEIMKATGKKTFVVGNIGNPYTLEAEKTDADSVTVAEISSFQLETIHTFRPRVSSILNITPDHLNRHHTMENYVKAKQDITKNQTKEDYCVLNAEDPYTDAFLEQCPATVILFSSQRELADGYFYADECIYKAVQGKKQKLMNIHEMRLLGMHNVENVMAAIAMADAYGADMEVILNVVRDFKAVEHRIEYVKTVRGVDYYNDSKGTNPDAAIKGIQAMNRPTILIGGGYDKQSDFHEWIQSFDGKVRYLVLIGATKEQIQKEAAECGFHDCILKDTFEEALDTCVELARPGDAVLLSPACASWGMFPNYEVRGEEFKKYVNAL